jgi:DNA invertase Pin-like site-specific DNA recombinase
MNSDHHQKVTPGHLKRDAYVYVRQSTLRQVMENTESTQRQYALRQRAVALGWPVERVTVIDNDLGLSGASAADREGFQKLVAEVSMGRAGIVLGLEVSRLARNCSDWHRLLEICALTGTLILDEDGLYDPTGFNDRLVLGLKGTMSEAELHVLRARLRGGIESKARRGELKCPLPVGLAYDPQDRTVLDPDRQVQESLRCFFQSYQRTNSATATVRYFREQKLLFPRRLRRGPNKGELVWAPMVHSRALQILHNPRYAGAFVFGRSHTRKTVDGHETFQRLPQEQWHTLLPGSHVGYISWEQYQQNQQQLRACAQAHGADRRHSPVGEGPALLQGLVMCGVCGQRMTVRYNQCKAGLTSIYVCQRAGIEHAHPICQVIAGAAVDKAIGELLLETLNPLTLDVALSVEQELRSRLVEVDRLRRQQVERARYEADLAQQRFMKVDPNNRLVADVLEAEWNQKLRVLHESQTQYEQQSQADHTVLDEKAKAQILALAEDFPRLWRDPRTSDRDRKRMVRLLIEDVTLIRTKCITAHVRFKGGSIRRLDLPLPLSAWQLRQTSNEVVRQIDRLLEQHTDANIALELNRLGLRSGMGGAFTRLIVMKIRLNYGLKDRYDRLREAGMLSQEELARALGICTSTVRRWHAHGLLRAHAYNDKNQCLYEPVGQEAPVKNQGKKLSQRRRFPEVVSDLTHEVQHAA